MRTSTNSPTPQVVQYRPNLTAAYMPSASQKVAKTLAPTDSQYLTSKFNFNATFAEICAGSNGGFIGILSGLGASSSGLDLTIATGYALIGTVTHKASATTLTLPDATSNICIWMTSLGVISAVTGSLSSPAGSDACLLCIVDTAAGACTIDYSGVVYVNSGIPLREVSTIDSDAPATWRGFTKAGNFLYFWNGQEYIIQREFGISVKTNTSNFSFTDTHEVIQLTGTLSGAITITVPNLVGYELTILNSSAGGFGAILSTGAGTTVTVANGKAAKVIVTSTGVTRVTADV